MMVFFFVVCALVGWSVARCFRSSFCDFVLHFDLGKNATVKQRVGCSETKMNNKIFFCLFLFFCLFFLFVFLDIFCWPIQSSPPQSLAGVWLAVFARVLANLIFILT